jgi:hypothetical protein
MLRSALTGGKSRDISYDSADAVEKAPSRAPQATLIESLGALSLTIKQPELTNAKIRKKKRKSQFHPASPINLP